MPSSGLKLLLLLTTLAMSSMNGRLPAEEGDSKKLVEQVIGAVGGEDKLLKFMRYRERVLITSTPAAKPAADEKGNRTSTIELGGRMWVGNGPREKDKVRVLMWAWSLRILSAPDAKISVIPDATVGGKQALGLKVTEAIKEPIELYFDPEIKLLIAIDYTDTRHMVSEWKKTEDGLAYASHVVGYRFTDRTKKLLNEKQWYQTDILELTALSELPANLLKK